MGYERFLYFFGTSEESSCFANQAFILYLTNQSFQYVSIYQIITTLRKGRLGQNASGQLSFPNSGPINFHRHRENSQSPINEVLT